MWSFRITMAFLGPNITLSTLFWNILYASFSSEHKIIKPKFRTHIQKNIYTYFQITWYGYLEKRTKLRKMDMRFGTRNVRRPYRVGYLMTVAKGIPKCKLDLVGVEEVRWDRTNRQIYIFLWKAEWESWIGYRFFFVHKGIILAIKRVEFVSDRISYIILRGHCCKSIVLNVHAPTEDKIDDKNISFYEGLDCVLDKFPKYCIKIMLRYLNAKVVRENIFKPATGNDCLHKISNGNGVILAHFATSKNLTVKNTMLPYRNIHTFQNYWVFWTLFIILYSKTIKQMFWKLDLFLSSGERGDTYYVESFRKS
jgi:hypothetical protein